MTTNAVSPASFGGGNKRGSSGASSTALFGAVSVSANSVSRIPTVGQHFKTKLCPSLFGSHKRCARGESCNYAHAREEMRSPPDLTKTKLCTNYIKNKCFDAGCKWAHGRRELRSTEDFYKVTICRYWQRGDCYAGNACRHAHGQQELRQPPPMVHAAMLRAQQNAQSSSSELTGHRPNGDPMSSHTPSSTHASTSAFSSSTSIGSRSPPRGLTPSLQQGVPSPSQPSWFVDPAIQAAHPHFSLRGVDQTVTFPFVHDAASDIRTEGVPRGVVGVHSPPVQLTATIGHPPQTAVSPPGRGGGGMSDDTTCSTPSAASAAAGCRSPPVNRGVSGTLAAPPGRSKSQFGMAWDAQHGSWQAISNEDTLLQRLLSEALPLERTMTLLHSMHPGSIGDASHAAASPCASEESPLPVTPKVTDETDEQELLAQLLAEMLASVSINNTANQETNSLCLPDSPVPGPERTGHDVAGSYAPTDASRFPRPQSIQAPAQSSSATPFQEAPGSPSFVPPQDLDIKEIQVPSAAEKQPNLQQRCRSEADALLVALMMDQPPRWDGSQSAFRFSVNGLWPPVYRSAGQLGSRNSPHHISSSSSEQKLLTSATASGEAINWTLA